MEAYIGEIRMFAGNYAPQGWKFCNGELLNIASDYEVLFALIGTTYGGDGRTNFRLPDLRLRVPIGVGQVPGSGQRLLGQQIGSDTVTLQPSDMPGHSHTINASTEDATTPTPGPGVTLAKTSAVFYDSGVRSAPTKSALAAPAIVPAGNVQPTAHPNLMPTASMNYIICVNGLYPSQG